MRNVHKILIGKSEGARPLERCRSIWACDIKTNLKHGVSMWTGCCICLRIGACGQLLWTR